MTNKEINVATEIIGWEITAKICFQHRDIIQYCGTFVEESEVSSCCIHVFMNLYFMRSEWKADMSSSIGTWRVFKRYESLIRARRCNIIRFQEKSKIVDGEILWRVKSQDIKTHRAWALS